MRARTSLWMIRVVTFGLSELLENASRDARKYKGPRWSLHQFTRHPS